jgi:hypothetical protein
MPAPAEGPATMPRGRRCRARRRAPRVAGRRSGLASRHADTLRAGRPPRSHVRVRVCLELGEVEGLLETGRPSVRHTRRPRDSASSPVTKVTRSASWPAHVLDPAHQLEARSPARARRR